MRTITLLFTAMLTVGVAPAQNTANVPGGALPKGTKPTTNAIKNYVDAPVSVPTKSTSADDVVQGSVHMLRLGTNAFVVSWTYTEAGAKKALARWEANPAHHPMPADWKVGWLKYRTDKGFFKTEEAATTYMKGLKAE